ncbi:MAG: DUF2007 domain-containing protein [bacterium]
MKELQSFSTRAEAELVCSLLRDEGIACIIKSDDCGGMRPNLAFATGGSQIYVDEKDYSKATQLLNPKTKIKKHKK